MTRLLRHPRELPEWAIVLLVRALWRPRPLGPWPGWHFGIGATLPGPSARLRRRVWAHCNRRSLELAVRVPWHRGLRLNLYPGNDLSWCLFVSGAIEPNELAVLDRLLQPGMVFVDGGANVGIYTLFASRRVSPTGQVLAFEPSPREYRRLRANLDDNGAANVRTFPVALAATKGARPLRVAGYGHEGCNTLAPIGSVPNPGEETVSTVTLDEVVMAERLDLVDMIKLDIEGAEVMALEGASGTLQRHRPAVLLEVNDEALAHHGTSPEHLLAMLATHGYATYSFSPDTGLPVPLHGERPTSSNVLALSQVSAKLLAAS